MKYTREKYKNLTKLDLRFEYLIDNVFTDSEKDYQIMKSIRYDDETYVVERLVNYFIPQNYGIAETIKHAIIQTLNEEFIKEVLLRRKQRSWQKAVESN